MAAHLRVVSRRVRPKFGLFLTKTQFPLQYRHSPGVRCFLSEAYYCNEDWAKRLDDPVLQKLKTINYAYELDRKFASEKKVSAVDIDMFVNSVTEADALEDVEDLVHRFRRTPNTVHTFPSTHHAVTRCFLQHKKSEPLMRMLNDRVNYGIFPDYHASNMMMDFFLKQKNHTDAAKVAVFLMLQEDFGTPVTRALSLHSCYSYLNNPQPQPWDTEAEPPEDDSGEEVLVRVRFVHQPFFDNHFDLTDPKKLVGKTLAYLGKEYSDALGNTSQLIGWAMFENWDRLQKFMEEVVTSNGKKEILKEGVLRLQQVLKEIPDDEAKTAESVQQRFGPLVEKLRGCAKDGDILQLTATKVIETLKEDEAKDIDQLKRLYSSWGEARNAELDRQIMEYMKQERIKQIKEKKKELAEKEERLFFFENIEKHRLNIPPEEEDELVTVEGKISAKSLLDVPPEIENKDGRYSAGIIEEHEPWWRWKEEKQRRAAEKVEREKKQTHKS